MVDRLMALLLLWGMRGGLAWFVADQYAQFVNEKFAVVSRAFGGF
ncbi:MAG: hypothetical protein AB7O50_08905 [Pseudolabrys sp.]